MSGRPSDTWPSPQTRAADLTPRRASSLRRGKSRGQRGEAPPSDPALQAIEHQPQVLVDRLRQEGDPLIGPRDERQVLLGSAHRIDDNAGGGEGESRPWQVERARDEDRGLPAVPPEKLGRVARVLVGAGGLLFEEDR